MSVDIETVRHGAGTIILDNQGTVVFSFCFGGRSQLAIESHILCTVRNIFSAQGGCSYLAVFMVGHLRGSCFVTPLLFLKVAVATPEPKPTH